MKITKKLKPKPKKQSTHSKQSALKTRLHLNKKSGRLYTKPTLPAKQQETKKDSTPKKKLSKNSIYNLDIYEDIKPKHSVNQSLKKRIKHAWRMLKG